MSRFACCIVIVCGNNDKKRKYLNHRFVYLGFIKHLFEILPMQEQNQHEYTDLSDDNRVLCDVVVVGVEQTYVIT